MGNKSKLVNSLPDLLDAPVYFIQEHFKSGTNELYIPEFITLQKNRRNGYGGVSISLNKKKLQRDFGWASMDYEFGSCEAAVVKLKYRCWNNHLFFVLFTCHQTIIGLKVSKKLKNFTKNSMENFIAFTGDWNCDLYKQ